MKFRSLFAVATLGLAHFAQAQEFNHHYDAYDAGFAQESWNIEQAGDGWMVFSGSYEPDTLGPDSIVGVFVIVLQRLDSEGNLTLEKRIQYSGHSIFLGWADCCDSIRGEGGLVVGGSWRAYYTSNYEARLMHITTTGDTLWSRSYGSPGHFWSGSQVKQTTDGGFIICGYTDATGTTDGFALKTDSLGIEQWRHTYGYSSVSDDYNCITLVSDGYVLTGRSHLTADNFDFWVTKLDTMGIQQWNTRFGSPYKEPSPSILNLQDGRLILSGGWGTNCNYFTTPYVVYLDPITGDTLYSRKYGATSYITTFFASKQFPNSDIILAGVSYVGGPQQGMLLRTTSDGDSLWMRNYYYYDEDVAEGEGRFFDVLPTADNGCIAAGVAYNPVNAPYPPGHSQDTWVVKVDSMGCVVPGCDGIIGITEQVTNLTGALHLYPNPVHGVLHVGITLPPKLASTGPLTITVTSLSGQVVLQEGVPFASPPSPLPGRGASEVVLDVGHLAAGTYALHLSDAHRWLAGQKFVVQ